MKKNYTLTTIILCVFLISCTTKMELIKKEKTTFGVLKYYVEKDIKNTTSQKRVLVSVDNAIFYRFYSDKITKQTKKDMNLIYTLFFDAIPDEMNDANYFQTLSKMDSIVLIESKSILDSLHWENYKKYDGAKAFIKEVNYYHR